MMKALLISLLLFSKFALAAEITLICIDSSNPNYQMTVTFDDERRKVLGEAISSVSDDVISFERQVESVRYKTYIYRATGRYAVYVGEKSSLSFGGTCQRKTANKF
jgi:hypothetical protein